MPNSIVGPVIGVDEAGRGPVIGPLVVAGVLINDQNALQRIGVKDSKKLSPERRQELSKEIRRLCSVEMAIIPAHEIDSLRRKFTLNQIEVNAFSRIVEELLINGTGEEDPTVILDAADVKADRFGMDVEAPLLMRMGSIPRVISEHKADDRYPAVGAASIIAKVIRDREVEKLRMRYGELGSGYPSDPKTREYLYNLFKDGGEIPSFVRKSWKTVSRIRDEACKTRLEDFF